MAYDEQPATHWHPEVGHLMDVQTVRTHSHIHYLC